MQQTNFTYIIGMYLACIRHNFEFLGLYLMALIK